MRTSINLKHVVPFIAIGLMMLVVASCAIQLPRDGIEPIAFPAKQEADPFTVTLDRCRTVTPEQPVELENCRRAWAENRRRFFTSTKPRWTEPDAPHSEQSETR